MDAHWIISAQGTALGSLCPQPGVAVPQPLETHAGHHLYDKLGQLHILQRLEAYLKRPYSGLFSDNRCHPICWSEVSCLKFHKDDHTHVVLGSGLL